MRSAAELAPPTRLLLAGLVTAESSQATPSTPRDVLLLAAAAARLENLLQAGKHSQQMQGAVRLHRPRLLALEMTSEKEIVKWFME
jgi:hypothetical protein